LNRTPVGGGRMQDIGEIHGEADLAPDPRARDIFASEQTKAESQAVSDRVLAPNQDLKLALAQAPVARKTAVDLASQRQPGIDIVQEREAAGVNVAARVLSPQHASASVPGKQEPDVSIDPGFNRTGTFGR
jgi:hypothetical protein